MKRALQERLVCLHQCVFVCVCVCVCVGSGDRSISRIRIDNKNRGGRVDELRLLLCNGEPENPPNVPLRWSFIPPAILLQSHATQH